MPIWNRETFANKADGYSNMEGWESMVDDMMSSLMEQYPDISYEDACEKLMKYSNDPDDQKAICEYAGKYF